MKSIKNAAGMLNAACLLKAAGIFSAAAVLAAWTPITVLASSPEFARTAAEWERLQDQVLEYDEIADLIHEYNVTVQNNQYEYHQFIKDYGTTKDDVSEAYLDLADELEASMTGEDGMAMVSDFQLEQQAKRLREQADDNLEDSRIYYLTYCQAEDSLVLSAQSKFLSYYKSQLELEAAKEQKQLLENSCELIRLQYQAGAATQSEVLEAEEALQNQEVSISQLERQIENTRQALIAMCGWTGSDRPEIKEVPEIDLPAIDQVDLEADKQKALETNYTLLINQQKLENAKNEDNRENIRENIASNKRQIGVSVTNAWQNLQTARSSYEQAEGEAATEERNLTLAAQKWSAGLITEYEYQQAQAEWNTKQLAMKISYLELFEALETYRWKVSGLADAE